MSGLTFLIGSWGGAMKIWEKQRIACKLHRLAENGNMSMSNREFFAALREHFLKEIKQEMQTEEEKRHG
jgi:hypothetical protein